MAEEKTITSKQFSLVFDKGKTIFRENDKSTEMYVITKGKVEISQELDITRDDKGKKLVLAILGPGDFFGEMSTFRGKTRSATAFAIEKTECIVMSQNTITSVIQQKPDVGIKIIKSLCDRIDHTNEKMEKLVITNGVERIINHFINISTGYGQKVFTESQIQYDQAVRVMSDRTNIDREIIIRSIKFLEKHDLIDIIERKGSKFIIIRKTILDRESKNELNNNPT